MQVVILGCGYVGTALGQQLIDDGHVAIGVRRSAAGCKQLERAGLQTIQADLTDPMELRMIPTPDWLVFMPTPDQRDATAARELHVEGLKTVIETFGTRRDPPARLVYTSSTGVYGDHGGDWVDETTPIDPPTDKTAALAEAESITLETAPEYDITGTVVRFGGLYGPDRYRMQRYLSGPIHEGYLNMIHRDDAAGAIKHILEADVARGEPLVAVDTEPVDRWTFADWLAEQCGETPPEKQTTEEYLANRELAPERKRRVRANKRCRSKRLQTSGYTFQYPTFREGYQPAISR